MCQECSVPEAKSAGCNHASHGLLMGTGGGVGGGGQGSEPHWGAELRH